MFNTGVDEKNFEEIYTDKNKLILYNGSVWVPVETTLLNLPFRDAWFAGAQEYYFSKEADPQFNIITTNEAWSLYTPSSLNIAANVELPSDQLVKSKLASEFMNISQKGSKVEVESEESFIRMIKLNIKQQNFESAKSLLEDAKSEFGETSALKIAEANYEFLNNNLESALSIYESYLAENPEDGGVHINKGILYYIDGDSANAINSLALGIDLLGGPEKVAEVVGINLEELPLTLKASDKKEKKNVSKSELKNLMKLALEKTDKEKVKTASQEASKERNQLAYGGRLSADPTQLMSITNLLYWKF